jgi:hypothetical protein
MSDEYCFQQNNQNGTNIVSFFGVPMDRVFLNYLPLGMLCAMMYCLQTWVWFSGVLGSDELFIALQPTILFFSAMIFLVGTILTTMLMRAIYKMIISKGDSQSPDQKS